MDMIHPIEYNSFLKSNVETFWKGYRPLYSISMDASNIVTPPLKGYHIVTPSLWMLKQLNVDRQSQTETNSGAINDYALSGTNSTIYNCNAADEEKLPSWGVVCNCDADSEVDVDVDVTVEESISKDTQSLSIKGSGAASEVAPAAADSTGREKAVGTTGTIFHGAVYEKSDCCSGNNIASVIRSFTTPVARTELKCPGCGVKCGYFKPNSLALCGTFIRTHLFAVDSTVTVVRRKNRGFSIDT
jgi:hypothetical protein